MISVERIGIEPTSAPVHPVLLTQSATTLGGGIAEAVRALSVALDKAGSHVTVGSVHDDGSRIGPWPEQSPLLLEGFRGPGMAVLPGLARQLESLAPDILHLHGLWTWFSVAVPGLAARRRIPYVVSPHGMLDSWALRRSAWKKRLAGMLWERRSMRRAGCLHALCGSEAGSILAYGVRGPVAVIPNGVEVPEVGVAEFGASRTGNGARKLLFLGRLHPKKGLLNALRAWNKVAGAQQCSGWQFVIAGWDQEGHEADLKRLCDDLLLKRADVPAARMADPSAREAAASEAAVVFTGPAFGVDKQALLGSASAFILPSFSEGLPVAVLEAWAYGLPALLTDHCNLPEGIDAGAALRIPTDVDGIAEGMRAITRLSDREREVMGSNGRALVEARFTWPTVAARMLGLYEWLLGSGPAPDFVLTR